jgi:hypothetical protein
MTIHRLLHEEAFDPEAIEDLARAYEDLLGDLQLVDRDDRVTQVVAKEVIRVARMGVRSAAQIRRCVLDALGNSQGIVSHRSDSE